MNEDNLITSSQQSVREDMLNKLDSGNYDNLFNEDNLNRDEVREQILSENVFDLIEGYSNSNVPNPRYTHSIISEENFEKLNEKGCEQLIVFYLITEGIINRFMPSYTNTNGILTPLFKALIFSKYNVIAKLLIKNGANVFGYVDDYTKSTPIELAIRTNNIYIISFILRHLNIELNNKLLSHLFIKFSDRLNMVRGQDYEKDIFIPYVDVLTKLDEYLGIPNYYSDHINIPDEYNRIPLYYISSYKLLDFLYDIYGYVGNITTTISDRHITFNVDTNGHNLFHYWILNTINPYNPNDLLMLTELIYVFLNHDRDIGNVLLIMEDRTGYTPLHYSIKKQRYISIIDIYTRFIHKFEEFINQYENISNLLKAPDPTLDFMGESLNLHYVENIRKEFQTFIRKKYRQYSGGYHYKYNKYHHKIALLKKLLNI